MKKSSFHQLIRTVINEMTSELAPQVAQQPAVQPPAAGANNNQSPRSKQLIQLAQQFQTIDNQAKQLKMWTKERAELEDQRMKVWWEMRKLMGLPNAVGKVQKEDHGLGYSHNVSAPEDANTMNKPTIGNT